MSYEHFINWRRQASAYDPSLSVVIPTCDDASDIISTIAAIAAHLSSTGVDFEIVISDGGSSDSTVERAQRLALRNVRVLSPNRRQGVGTCVRAGALAARGRHILLVDALLTTPIEHVDRLLAVAQNGGDLIVGGRAFNPDEPHARFAPWLMRGEQANRRRGFTLLTKQAAQRLFANQRCSGDLYDLELLWRAKRLQLETVDVPANWFDVPPELADDPFAPPCRAVVTLPERFDRFAPNELSFFTPIRGERVCIDGSQVRHADAVAIQSLVDARLRFLDANADFYITSPSDSLRITLELTGDDALLKPAVETTATQPWIRSASPERIENLHHEWL